MKKALSMLKNELSREEYLTRLETLTPKVDDATEELRDKNQRTKPDVYLKRSKEITGQQLR